MKIPFFGAISIIFFAVSAQIQVHGADLAVKLPQPEYDGNISVEKALQKRRSVRKYGKVPITLSNLSQLLWAAQGVTRPGGLRTAPSAGALYPLEVYVVGGNIDGLQAGVYVYKPGGHELLKLTDGDKRTELRKAALGQSAIKDAAAVLVIAAVYERTTVKYGERGIRYVHMEAGHAAQNVCLQAVSLNLGTVVIGAFDDDGVRKAANLTIREQPLYLLPTGVAG